jgi:hypothetical protein
VLSRIGDQNQVLCEPVCCAMSTMGFAKHRSADFLWSRRKAPITHHVAHPGLKTVVVRVFEQLLKLVNAMAPDPSADAPLIASASFE